MAHRLVQETAKAPPRPRRGEGLAWRRGLPAAGYLVPPAIALVLAGIAWELWVRIDGTPVYIVPRPSVVLDRLFGDLGFFAKEGGVTLMEALGGFGLGSAVAIAAAVTMAHSRPLEKSLFPLAILVKVTPIVAIAPLFTIWFGFGIMPKVLIAALLAFFPVLVNGVVGFRSVNPGALDFVRSLRASPLEVFWQLRVPSALPYLFAAFRIAIPLAVIGAVVAEWFSGEAGLGAVIIVAHNNLDMPTLFSAIVTLAVIGIGLTIITTVIERRLVFWHESTLAQ
ncbi:MAG: ABC transporter permease [Dehalococcoidia bacterium]